MLVSASIENWMSFRNKATFSMIASKERQHGERVPKLHKYQTRILPVAAIYGGNASGKTNFFEALSFAKKLITKGTPLGGLIPVEPFRLDTKASIQPSRFSFLLLIDETMYEFSFAVIRNEVLEEKLVIITSTSEKVLYDRHRADRELSESLAKMPELKYAFAGTQDNQLFLTNSVSQKIEVFKPVFDWFNDSLELIAPDSRFEPFEQFFDQDNPLFIPMNEMLPLLDTGISHLGSVEIPLANVSLPSDLKTKLMEQIKEGMTVRLTGYPASERFIISCKNGELLAKRLVAYHSRSDGSETSFEIRQESDGSQRIIDLLPAFLDLASGKSRKTYVIDELDRSLHTLLTRQLLGGYLSTCSVETRTQLLFTTQDALLMDQDLLRRDEMWVAERDGAGSSSLTPFSEYKDVRYDKDIRKSYLQGRLGGIPHLKFLGPMVKNCGQPVSGGGA